MNAREAAEAMREAAAQMCDRLVARNGKNKFDYLYTRIEICAAIRALPLPSDPAPCKGMPYETWCAPCGVFHTNGALKAAYEAQSPREGMQDEARDAARYRWLIADENATHPAWEVINNINSTPQEISAAIDAALNKHNEG